MKSELLQESRKVWILGAVASGKTTLARKLAQMRNCHYYELDNLVYVRRKTGNMRRSANEIREVVNRIKCYEEWIIEGVYRKDYHYLLEEVDCIVVLETSSSERERRILTRWVKQNYGYELCSYVPTIEMLKCMYSWSEGYDADYHQLEKILNPYSSKVMYLQSDSL